MSVHKKPLPRTAIAAFFIVAFAFSADAQEGWESVPFSKWGKKELTAILSDSPWARNFEAPINVNERVGSLDLTIRVNALFLLRSALPVRRALLRQRQLDANYDKMNPGDKQEFDQRNVGLIECNSCKEYYSVSVISSHQDVWEGEVTKEVSELVYLSNEKGERRNLAHVIAPGSREMIFLFKRFNAEGKPLLDHTSKKLTFTSDLYPRSPKSPRFLSKVEFDVVRITREGEVLF